MPSQHRNTSRVLVMVAGLAILLLAWVWTRGRAPRAPAQTSASVAAVPPASDIDPPPPHAHADDLHAGDTVPDPDLTAHFFDAPRLADDAHFAPTATRLLPGAGCQAHPVFARDASAETRMGQLYAVATRERFPQDLFYRNLTQFWQEGGRHYQLSATWDIGLPPVYQVRLHESANADFSGDVREIAPPVAPPAVLDAAATSDYIAGSVRAATRRGARMGLRILEVEWPADADGGRVRATFADGRPATWSFPGGRCVLAEGFDAMQCQCRFRPTPPATGAAATS